MANPIISAARAGRQTFVIVLVAAAWLLTAMFVARAGPVPRPRCGYRTPILAGLLVRFATVRVLAVSVGGMIVLGSSSDSGRTRSSMPP